MKSLVILTGNAHVGRGKLIRKLNRQGALFMPLGLRSFTELQKMDAHIVTVNAFINRSEWVHVETLASELADEWNKLLGQYQNEESRDIASNDGAVLESFWNEIATAHKIAEICNTLPLVEVHLFGFSPARPALYTQVNDTVAIYLKKTLPGHLQIRVHLPGLSMLSRHIVRQIRNAVMNLISLGTRNKNSSKLETSGKPLLFCAVNPHEWARFEKPFGLLSTRFKLLVSATDLDKPAIGSLQQNIHRRLGAISFMRGILHLASPNMRPVLSELDFQFKELLLKRWPQLALRRRDYRDVILNHQPAATIVSSLDDLESQLPAIVSKFEGIPSIALPHSHVVPTSKFLHVDALAYQYNFQKIFGRGYKDLQLLGPAEILPDSIYKPNLRRLPIPSKPLILVVGADLGGYVGQGALRLSLLDDQMRVLQDISEFLETHGESVDVVIKPHPLFPAQDELKLLCEERGIMIAEPEDSLEQWAEISSAVVTVNLAGSAILTPKRLKKAAFMGFTADFLALQTVFHLDSLLKVLGPNEKFEEFTLTRALSEALLYVCEVKRLGDLETQILYDSVAFEQGVASLADVVWCHLGLETEGTGFIRT